MFSNESKALTPHLVVSDENKRRMGMIAFAVAVHGVVDMDVNNNVEYFKTVKSIKNSIGEDMVIDVDTLVSFISSIREYKKSVASLGEGYISSQGGLGIIFGYGKVLSKNDIEYIENHQEEFTRVIHVSKDYIRKIQSLNLKQR